MVFIWQELQTLYIFIGLTWSTLLVELLFNLGSGPVLVQTAVVHASGIEELKLPRKM